MKKNELALKVALACRILYMEGHGDFSLGHVSARDDDRLVWMKPSGFGLEEVTAEDIIALNMDGEVVQGKHKPHNELPIHLEILRYRPDVNCVIHTHPPYAVALGCLDRPLMMLNHDAVPLAGKIAYFFDTPDLLTTREQGESLARCLGDKRAVLLKNHGIVVTGKSVEEAVCLAIHLEKAAALQFIVNSSGREIKLDMALKMRDDADSSSQRYPSFFAYLVRKLERNGLKLS